VPPWTLPSRKIFVTETSTLPHLIVFEFQLSSFSSFRDNRGCPKFTLGALHTRMPPSGKILTHPKVLAYHSIAR